jgi:Na+/proline symporter
MAVSVASQGAVQRYASLPSVAAGRRMLAVNGIGTALVCLLFFVLGTVIFAFYVQHPAGTASVFPTLPRKDQVTIHFVRTELPYPGLIGLLLAGLFITVMGSISAGLSALSSLLVCDWFPGHRPGLGSSRRMSAVFGVATIGMALVAPYLGEHVFDIIIRISGAFFGPLLGLFVLGARSDVPTRRAH